MSRTPARFTQSDIARCIRAVQQCEADMRVRLAPDGSIIIERGQDHTELPALPPFQSHGQVHYDFKKFVNDPPKTLPCKRCGKIFYLGTTST